MADTEKSVKIEEGDPQSVQDLTGFVPFDIQHVQTLLQQMQDKFQQMSDQIITRNILLLRFSNFYTDNTKLKVEIYFLDLCTELIFAQIRALDDMSTRIDDLEKNIGELMNQAGVDEPEK